MIQQWVSVLEAASVLGVSESTVRRRVQRDQLPCRMNSTGRLEILVDMTDGKDDALAAALVIGPRRVSESSDRVSTSERVENTMTPAKSGRPRMWALPRPDQSEALGETCWELDDAEGAEASEASSEASLEVQAEHNPFMQKPTEPVEPTSEENEAISRFQRMAGASIVLAEKQADEAAEELARVRYSMNRTQNRYRIVCGVALFLGFVVTLDWFSPGKSDPQSAAATPAGLTDAWEEPSDEAPSQRIQKQLDRQAADVEALTREIRALRQTLGHITSTQTSSAG